MAASQIEKKESNVVTLTIEIPAEDFNQAVNRAYRRNAKRFNIPGFRKGKAPLGMVKRYYGEAVLYEDAIDDSLNPAYQEAVKEHGIEPVSQPSLDIQEIGSEKGLKATVTVTVKPDVQLGQYKGVEAEKPEATVTDEDVDNELKRIQERNARLVPVDDRAVEAGDTANINYEGFKDGVAFAGGKADDHDLEIGSDSFIPGFEDAIIGHNPGDEFDVPLTFPEKYHDADLAGQPVVFKVRLNSIKVKEVPELDDEFAKDVSEFDTLAEYKEDLRQAKLESAEKAAESTFENNALRAAVDNAEIDLPEVMVENEIDAMVRQQEEQMQGMGISLDQYLGFLGQNMEEFRSGLAKDAENRVRTSLVLEAIVAAEAIEVTPEEQEKELQELADRYQMEVDKVKEIFGDSTAMFDNDIKFKKAIDLVREQAVAVPVSATEETADQTDADEA